MLCASCAGECARVREGTAGRPKRKRGTMPSCQRSVRPPTILPTVLRTSQRPGLQLFSETSGLNQFGPRITIVRTLIASRHDCRLASGTARNAPTLRHVREEGLGRTSPRPREVAPRSRPGGLPANSYGSSPGPIKALGAGRSGITKQSLFFVRNIFNGTFRANARRIHEHCER